MHQELRTLVLLFCPNVLHYERSSFAPIFSKQHNPMSDVHSDRFDDNVTWAHDYTAQVTNSLLHCYRLPTANSTSIFTDLCLLSTWAAKLILVLYRPLPLVISSRDFLFPFPVENTAHADLCASQSHPHLIRLLAHKHQGSVLRCAQCFSFWVCVTGLSKGI